MEDEKFSIDTSNEDLEKTFSIWKKESISYHDEMLPQQKLAEEYYKGNQTDMELIPDYKSNTVENRIFEAIETITPIVTASAHHFLVLPGSDNEVSVEKANKLSKVLERKYQTLEMQEKLEQIVRHIMLYRFGVVKWYWNFEKDDVDIKVIDPRLILIPKMRLNPHDLPYKIEIQEYTKKEMEENFPKIKIDEFTPETQIDIGQTTQKKKLYRVFEVWTSEMVVWFSNNKVLDKKANPYWDFEGTEKNILNIKNKPKISKTLQFANHFDRPTDCFVFFTTFNVSDGPVASVSLVEVDIPLQDAINVQKRQIIDNLRRLGNGQVYIDKDVMSQEEAENITDEVGLIIRGEVAASLNKVRREPGMPLPSGHFENLTHSESAFDNIIGVHGATRGNAKSNTLGQDLVSRQQDFTRIDLITRVLNRGVARIANGLVQMMRMYYDKSKVIKILGDDGAVEFVRMNGDDIEDWIEIEVRSGQQLPMDKVSIRTEAVQLWQLGALDPVSLYERLDFTNPEKFAGRLIAWKQGQLSQETQAKLQADLTLTRENAKLGNVSKISEINAKAAGNMNNESDKMRNVETPFNSQQRAMANLGGGAPSLPRTPKLAGQKQLK